MGAVLLAVDQFDVRVSALLPRWEPEIFGAFAVPSAGRLPEYPGLIRHIRWHERLARDIGSRPRVVRAVFQSPGFITVDGSGALEKLVDILHSGDLAKEERRAIIERIRAETEVLRSQAIKQKMEALSGAVGVLQALGMTAEQILGVLQSERGLINLLGEPTAELELAKATGSLEKIEIAHE